MKYLMVHGLMVLMLGSGLMISQFAQSDEHKHCNNAEYKQLEDRFLDLVTSKKERFFKLDRLCMLELGLDKDDIVERRTIFLMGSMNYEHYGELEQ
jgi:hypothetical protein